MRLLNVWALTGGVLLAQAPVGAVEEKARVRQMAMGREYARELRTETRWRSTAPWCRVTWIG
ncbi:MAG: hypothetical protein QM757_03655 [Paludibaculum sp.]